MYGATFKARHTGHHQLQYKQLVKKQDGPDRYVKNTFSSLTPINFKWKPGKGMRQPN